MPVRLRAPGACHGARDVARPDGFARRDDQSEPIGGTRGLDERVADADRLSVTHADGFRFPCADRQSGRSRFGCPVAGRIRFAEPSAEFQSVSVLLTLDAGGVRADRL